MWHSRLKCFVCCTDLAVLSGTVGPAGRLSLWQTWFWPGVLDEGSWRHQVCILGFWYFAAVGCATGKAKFCLALTLPNLRKLADKTKMRSYCIRSWNCVQYFDAVGWVLGELLLKSDLNWRRGIWPVKFPRKIYGNLHWWHYVCMEKLSHGRQQINMGSSGIHCLCAYLKKKHIRLDSVKLSGGSLC